MATLLLVLIYIAFISLGLPDALLGAGWPVMQTELNIPYSLAGLAQIIISGGTIVASMFSGLFLRKYGTGKVTAFSVAMTAVALLGFSVSPSFLWILVSAVPLGLGAGAVDTGLNVYVANHYESRHMSWLHSFWGVGALGGPLVLAVLLGNGASWRRGYQGIGWFQLVLVFLLISAIPLWHTVGKEKKAKEPEDDPVELSLFASLRIPGVPTALIVFLFYCGIEASMSLWGGSYLFKVKGMDAAAAASWVSFFFASLTVGRFLTGFLTLRFSNNEMILGGISIVFFGVTLILIPLPLPVNLAGYILVGLGCAPIFPSMLHETPARFGKGNAQAIMGFQMAIAYIGSTFLPPLFGFIAGSAFMSLFPWFLIGYAFLMLAGFLKLISRNPSAVLSAHLEEPISHINEISSHD